MDATCKKLDKKCVCLQTLAGWVTRNGLLPIPYVGPGGGQFRNPAAPHIELVFLAEGAVRQVHVGNGLVIDIPVHHVSVQNVHFGNTSIHYAGIRSLCLFLDIGHAPALACLGRQAFAQIFPIQHPARLAEAFHRVGEGCRAISGTTGSYPKGRYGYSPKRDRGAGEPERLLLQAATMELLGMLWLEAVRPEGIHEENQYPLPVRQSLDFMANHWADPNITLHDIARAAHLSSAHFGRVFEQKTGGSPMARLRQLRIEKACQLLNQSCLRIQEVAEHVGIPDPFHFSRIFHAVMGQSPRAYRTRCQKAQ